MQSFFFVFVTVCDNSTTSLLLVFDEFSDKQNIIDPNLLHSNNGAVTNLVIFLYACQKWKVNTQTSTQTKSNLRSSIHWLPSGLHQWFENALTIFVLMLVTGLLAHWSVLVLYIFMAVAAACYINNCICSPNFNFLSVPACYRSSSRTWFEENICIHIFGSCPCGANFTCLVIFSGLQE